MSLELLRTLQIQLDSSMFRLVGYGSCLFLYTCAYLLSLKTCLTVVHARAKVDLSSLAPSYLSLSHPQQVKLVA